MHLCEYFDNNYNVKGKVRPVSKIGQNDRLFFDMRKVSGKSLYKDPDENNQITLQYNGTIMIHQTPFTRCH